MPRYRRLSVLAELSRATAMLSRVLERELARAGVPQNQRFVLALIHAYGPITPSALELESGLAGSTLREGIGDLLGEGLVRRLPNEADRRSYFLDSTPAGAAALDAAVPEMGAVEEALERELGVPLESYRESVELLRTAARTLLEHGLSRR